MGGGVITPPYNGWYETYEFKFYDLLIKADNLNTNLCSAGLYRQAFSASLSAQPSATSSIIIRVKPREKEMAPMLECSPWDISGISSSTTTYSMAPAAKPRK